MGRLQRLIGQILTRLRDVNTSQRVALLLGGALVAVSLVWLVHWAASPEYVPLLEQDLPGQDIALVRSGLEAMNEPFQVRGSRIFVPAGANRAALLAQLQQQEKLPANTSAGFAALVKESDPWISADERDRRWTYALQKELELVLRQFHGVQSASVFLNLGAPKRVFTRVAPPSSASVTLVMRNGEEVPRPLALAAARLVAGAVAGLPVQNVQVVDANGRTAVDWDGEQSIATQLERKVVKEELRYAEKIRAQVPDPKALVSVQVELNSTTSNTETEQPLKGLPVAERTTRVETNRGQTSAEPGVTPNVALRAGGATVAEMHQEETSETENRIGLAKKVEATPAGDVQKVTAAISLSHSYLTGVFQRARGDGESPTEAQIEEVFQRERARLLAQVVQLVKPQAEENVAISRYYDSVEAALGGPGVGKLDTAFELVRSYGPQSALGLLALLALGMMLRLARRSDAGESFGLELGLPKEAIEAAKAAAADVSALAEQAAAATVRQQRRSAGAGRAGAVAGAGVAAGPEPDLASPVENAPVTEGLLVAQEVDASTVQTRKMLEQVTQMVESDPEVVSSLVEQWLQRQDQYRDEAT